MNTLNEKQINWLIKSAGLSPEDPKLTELVKNTFTEAHRVPRRRPVADVTLDYVTTREKLTSRVFNTQQVLSNTINKFHYSNVDPTLAWAYPTKPVINIISIKAEVADSRNPERVRMVDVTDKLLAGEKFAEDNTFVEFDINTAYSSRPPTRVTLPLSLLHNDPIGVSQHARKLCRAHELKRKREAIEKLSKECEELEAKLAETQEKLTEAKEQA
jgi:hypothetical protein